MSIYRNTKVTCPRCNSINDVLIWETINSQLNPEAKEKLLSHDINKLKCIKCGFEAMLRVPLLYHDMVEKYMVQFFPFDMIEKENILSNFDEQGYLSLPKMPDEMVADYFSRIHIAFSLDELIRYILFRDKLATKFSQLGHERHNK